MVGRIIPPGAISQGPEPTLILAEVTRGSVVESRHHGAYWVIGAGGVVLASFISSSWPLRPALVSCPSFGPP
jgi:L-asparaginase II